MMALLQKVKLAFGKNEITIKAVILITFQKKN